MTHKTAEEIINEVIEKWVVHPAGEFAYCTKADIIKAMEKYAQQFKYDYSQECNCDSSPGSTWCCNLCGLPISKK